MVIRDIGSVCYDCKEIRRKKRNKLYGKKEYGDNKPYKLGILTTISVMKTDMEPEVEVAVPEEAVEVAPEAAPEAAPEPEEA